MRIELPPPAPLTDAYEVKLIKFDAKRHYWEKKQSSYWGLKDDYYTYNLTTFIKNNPIVRFNEQNVEKFYEAYNKHFEQYLNSKEEITGFSYWCHSNISVHPSFDLFVTVISYAEGLVTWGRIALVYSEDNEANIRLFAELVQKIAKQIF